MKAIVKYLIIKGWVSLPTHFKGNRVFEKGNYVLVIRDDVHLTVMVKDIAKHTMALHASNGLIYQGNVPQKVSDICTLFRLLAIDNIES